MSGYQRIVAYDRSLFPSNPSLSNSIPWHSNNSILVSLSLSLSLSLVLFLFLFNVHCFRCTPQTYPIPPPSFPSLSMSRYFLHKPASFLSSILCRSLNLLSSRASTRLPNTAISALSPLRYFNYEMINSWPVCLASSRRVASRRSFPPPLRTAASSFRRQPFRVSSVVKLVRSIDSID